MLPVLYIFVFFLLFVLIGVLHFSSRGILCCNSINLSKLIGYTPPPGFYTYNPSVCYDASRQRMYISIRVSNKGCGVNPSVTINKLLMAYIDNFDLTTVSTREDNIDVEDIRLWVDNRKLYGIGSYVNKSRKNQMMIIQFDPNDLRILNREKIESEKNEKNWAPIISSDPQLFVYSWDPFLVISLNAKKIKTETISNMIKRGVVGAFNLKNCRGGSQVIRQRGGGFLTIVHTRDIAGKNYRHYFVQLDDKLNIVRVSDSFCIGTNSQTPTLCGIEFISGVCEFGDKLAITYGKTDCTAHISFVDHKNLWK